MSRRHESLFSYGITRPYPFTWFTPSVVIGALIFTALFSTINFYTNGFELVNQSTTDPTNAVTRTFSVLPTFLQGKVKPSCEPVEIPIASTIFTNQTALTYQVDSVKQCDDGMNWVSAPSLRYYGDSLGACTIMSITVTFESRGQSPEQRAWSQWAPRANAFIECNITIKPDPIFNTVNNNAFSRVNLTTQYSYVPLDVFNPPPNGQPSSEGLFAMTYQDIKNKASMWWGSSLLSMYWVQVAGKMTIAMENAQQSVPVNKGVIYFIRNKTITDIESLDFFDIDYRFYQDNPNGTYQTLFANDTSTNNFSPRDIAAFDAHQTYPNVWIPADSFAKSFYSTILTDLGQSNSPSNILSDTNALTYFTANFSQILADMQSASVYAVPSPGLQSFAEFSASSGPLNVSASKIQSLFICQVPQYRPPFDIFVSVLTQDLVLLNSVWHLFTLLVGIFFLTYRYAGPDVMACSGCVSNVNRIADMVRPGDVETVSRSAETPPMKQASENWGVRTSYQPVNADEAGADDRVETATSENTTPVPPQRPSSPMSQIRSTFTRAPRRY